MHSYDLTYLQTASDHFKTYSPLLIEMVGSLTLLLLNIAARMVYSKHCFCCLFIKLKCSIITIGRFLKKFQYYSNILLQLHCSLFRLFKRVVGICKDMCI